MLVEFSVANFRSVLARQTLSLVASADAKHAASNVLSVPDSSLSLLKSTVIFGANAAGKSNILRAVETFRLMVRSSSLGSQAGQRLPVVPFLFDVTSVAAPSEFEIIFIADDGVRYHYHAAATAERVVREWLVAYPVGRPQRWFEREYREEGGNEEWWFGPNFRGTQREHKLHQDFTRPNALFLSTAIQLNNAQLLPVFKWITEKLVVLSPGISMNPMLSLEMLREKDGHDKLMTFMRAADVGIDRLELREEEPASALHVASLTPGEVQVRELGLQTGAGAVPHKQRRVISWHRVANGEREVPLDFGDESDGTQKLLEFGGGWLRALDSGATLFVDELDRSLHPYITRFLVGLFHGPRNTNNAQLIFTTHDTSLLEGELLRRDQIWLVEKDERNASKLFPMLDFSPRADEALARGYLKGRYGAVPLVKQLTD